MPDSQELLDLVSHTRLRALLQALLTAMEQERDEAQPSDYALLRALLFRIGLELGLPGSELGPARQGLLAEGVLAHEHLHDIERALTALEVLGDPHRLEFRMQALLFVEWQLARLDRLDPRGHASALPEPVAQLGNVMKQALPAPPTPADLGRVGLRGASNDLRDRRLLRDSLARARGVPRHRFVPLEFAGAA
jgi:hypothetical protein